MKRFLTFSLTALLAAHSALLSAKPAPWYTWRSKADARLVCSQTPLGPGWEQARGPYQDSRCKKLITAK
jgi:hypothetical protein